MKTFNTLFATIIVGLSFQLSVFAQSKTWTNASNDDDWHNPLNWNPTVIPTIADQVIIPENEIINIFDGTAVANNLTVEEGAIVTIFSGNLVMNQGVFAPSSELNILGGVVQVSGTLVINGELNTIGMLAKSLVGAGVLNSSINITGTMHVQSPSDPLTLSNVKLDIFPSGTLTIEEGVIEGSGKILNRGLIQKTAGTSTFGMHTIFENDGGIVNINSGSMETTRVTTLNGGEINIAENSFFELKSFTSDNYFNGTLTGELNGPFVINSKVRLLGTEEAFLNFSGPAGVEWRGGSIFSAGGINTNTTIVNQGLLIITGTGPNELALTGGTTLRNEADIFINGTASLFRVYASSLLNNSDTGEITVVDDVFIIGSVLNTGIFQKLTGTGETSIDNFTNNAPGILNIVIGQINCNSNYEGSGIIKGSGSIKTNPFDTVASTIAPGNDGVGTLTLINPTQFEALPECVYQLEINGTTPDTEHDVFAIDSNAKLNGTFDVSMGFDASIDDEFVVITANNITTCSLPAQVSADFNGMTYTYDVVCNADNVTLKVINVTLGVEDFVEDLVRLGYPNPTKGHFTIELNKNYETVTTSVSNYLGQNILNRTYNNANSIQLEIDGNSGLYFVQLLTPEGVSKTLKVVKN